MTKKISPNIINMLIHLFFVNLSIFSKNDNHYLFNLSFLILLSLTPLIKSLYFLFQFIILNIFFLFLLLIFLLRNNSFNSWFCVSIYTWIFFLFVFLYHLLFFILIFYFLFLLILLFLFYFFILIILLLIVFSFSIKFFHFLILLFFHHLLFFFIIVFFLLNFLYFLSDALNLHFFF